MLRMRAGSQSAAAPGPYAWGTLEHTWARGAWPPLPPPVCGCPRRPTASGRPLAASFTRGGGGPGAHTLTPLLHISRSALLLRFHGVGETGPHCRPRSPRAPLPRVRPVLPRTPFSTGKDTGVAAVMGATSCRYNQIEGCCHYPPLGYHVISVCY